MGTKETPQATERYSANVSYPPVQVEKPNRMYAQMMLSNLGGSNSEMSAVSLYFYNHLMTQEQKDISLMFHKISMVEMHHLEIFGQLAKQLGADPRLWAQRGNRKIYWTPAYNRYPSNLKNLLWNAINSEKAAIKKYEIQAQQIQDANIVENLQRIIVDEQIHIDIMTRMCEKYSI